VEQGRDYDALCAMLEVHKLPQSAESRLTAARKASVAINGPNPVGLEVLTCIAMLEICEEPTGVRTIEPAPVKRGPGRPRKNPEQVDNGGIDAGG
jgi:hypothetical protein